jgi:ankyrin repeat protein
MEGNAINVAAYIRRGARAEVVCSDYLLQTLAQQGFTDVIRTLVTAGARIDFRPGPNGYTPLQAAAAAGQTETVTFLVGCIMADSCETSDFLGDALRLAAWHGHKQTVNYLLDIGVDANARGSRAETPLMWASRNGHDKIVRILLEHGADPNAISSSEMTAFRLAKKYGREGAAALLRIHGAIDSTSRADSLRDRLSGILINKVNRLFYRRTE